MSTVRSYNGFELDVGDKVAIVNTANKGQHEFLSGEIVRFGSKQVVVAVPIEKACWNDGTQLYRRNPEQVIRLHY